MSNCYTKYGTDPFTGTNKTNPNENKSSFLANAGCLIICLALLVPIIFGLRGCANGIGPTYQRDGTVIGVVTSLSDTGIIWKCYEGHCFIGAYADNINAQTNMNAHSWHFSVPDPEMVTKVQALMGKRVKITYNKWWSKPLYQDTRYTVIGIEEDNGK